MTFMTIVLVLFGMFILSKIFFRCKIQRREEGKYITDFIAEKLRKGELRVPLEVLKR